MQCLRQKRRLQLGAIRDCPHPLIGQRGFPVGALVAKTLPLMACDVAGKDAVDPEACDGGGNEGAGAVVGGGDDKYVAGKNPVGPKACDGTGNEGGVVTGGEDDSDLEYPFFQRNVLHLSPLELGP